MSYRLSFLAICILLVGPNLGAQESSPPRDAQAVAVLQQAFAAMGGMAPQTTVATGSITIEAGGAVESGRIRVLTRGLDQLREDSDLGAGQKSLIFSGGMAAEQKADNKSMLSLEMAVSTHWVGPPLLLVAGILVNPDFAVEYVGEESLDGVPVHHLRFWNTFASKPELKDLAELSVKDIWIEASSGLPVKLAHEEREARGAAPRVAIAAYYADYRNVGGILYPFAIRRSYNGTPWAVLKLESVVVNSDLSNADFRVR